MKKMHKGFFLYIIVV